MKINKVACIWFSPTHGSRRVARAVAEGLAHRAACAVETLDATRTALPARSFGAGVAAVVAVPVYGDAAAPIALERLAALRAERAPALAVVTYGNRSFGHAAHDLARALAAQGFDVVGAGAFVGEHSYSSPATPIAPGRPDAADLAQARSWGDAAARRLLEGRAAAVDATRLPHPADAPEALQGFAAFVGDYARRQKEHPVRIAATADADRCTGCGACAEACPVGAIPAGEPASTLAESCIKCAACVKVCPAGARRLDTPFAPVLARFFSRPKPNVMLPAPAGAAPFEPFEK